jgi:hypothetical protein
MNIDKGTSANHTETVGMPSPGQFADAVLNDTIGLLSALVIDFDSVPSGEVFTLLSESSDDSLFVVWWPLGHGPAEEALLRHTLVERGATLLERAAPEETIEQCWSRFKARFVAQRKARIEATKPAPLPHRAETASETESLSVGDREQPVSSGEPVAEIG